MSRNKKLIMTTAQKLSDDVFESFLNDYPLMFVVKNFHQDGSSTIRFDIHNEEELVKALVDMAKTGTNLSKVERFICNARCVLDEVSYQIAQLSKLN